MFMHEEIARAHQDLRMQEVQQSARARRFVAARRAQRRAERAACRARDAALQAALAQANLG